MWPLLLWTFQPLAWVRSEKPVPVQVETILARCYFCHTDQYQQNLQGTAWATLLFPRVSASRDARPAPPSSPSWAPGLLEP